MGQATATMIWRLLGREAGGKSLLCHHNDDGETSDSVFRRYWTICRSIIRRLLGRGAGSPPSDPPSYHTTPSIHHRIVDIGIDHERVSEADIREVAIRVAEDNNVEEKIASEAEIREVAIRVAEDNNVEEKIVSEAEIREVAIRVAEDNNVEEKIGRLPPPAREVPPIDISRRRRRRRKLGPYSWEQKILLVGEGDFSFSASLAVAFGDASNMIATSLDSFDFLMQNYAGAANNILELTSKSCKVMHGVNATKMANHPQLQSLKFDCIVYNFPHAGFSNLNAPREAQLRKHQKLVRGFLANAKKMIKDDGQIHISHKCVGFFREWDIEMLGESQGLRLVEESPFNLRHYPGYNTKYGYGGDKNFDWKPAKTYKFGLANSSPKKTKTKKTQNN